MPIPFHLTYVLNHGDSLKQWDDAGLFYKQTALIRDFRDRGAKISIVSHGGREEREYAPRLPGMRILCNWLGLPKKIYARRLHQLHAPQLLRSDMVQTNDAAAIVVALRIAWAWRLPLVYRFGFVLSTMRKRTLPERIEEISRIEGMERKGLEFARLVISPSKAIAADMTDMVGHVAQKMAVIPNFVDTKIFRPLPGEKKYDLIFVGRTTIEKNLWALLEAIAKLDVSIAIAGGPLPREIGTMYDLTGPLKEKFGDLDGRVHWLGRIENNDLPPIINQARAFILTSFTEGTNRALTEAMACGLPCIVTRVPELKYMIDHGVTGYVCDLDSDSIARAVSDLLAQPELMRKMGAKALEVAREQYSFEGLAQKEFDLLLEIARENQPESARARIAHYLLRHNPSVD